VQINRNIFRAYDIRGNVERDLSPQFAHLLGRTFGELVKSEKRNEIAIAWDCRKTSALYADNVRLGLLEAGVNCVILGLCSTPQLYWSIVKNDFGGGVQVTGSHNAITMNGFKLCLGAKGLSTDQIIKLHDSMVEHGEMVPELQLGTERKYDCHAAYVDDLFNLTKEHFGDRHLKVVIDGGNGVAGPAGAAVLKKLGVEVIELFCEPDGSFPNHHPDPSVEANLQNLIEKVCQEKADLGIAWDGDGDRIGVVDERGEIIFVDILILLYALEILKEEAGITVVADVKCSDKLFSEVNKAGGKAIMWHSGHSLMKQKVFETGAALGGELSGHIFFKHRFYGFDDGVYCACRLLEILSNTDKTLSELIAQYPKTVATPEIRVPCPDEIKFEVITKLQERLKDLPICTLDGVRITFNNGWGLVRASNTEPALTLRVEADTATHLSQYRSFLEGLVAEVRE
jgi:phosphomannomutase/phosphoglucomutase